MTGKFTLKHGCHRGTLTSRDSTSEDYNSYDEAHRAYLRHRAFYHSVGYQIWFAVIVSPSGDKTRLEAHPYIA